MLDQLNQVLGYLHGMWRFRWSALLVTWIVATIGWAVVYVLPNQYEAKAVVFIDTDSVMKPLLKGLAVESDSFDEIAVMSRVLLSRDNLLALIRETDMDLQVDTEAGRFQLMEKLAKKINLKGGGTHGRKKNNIYEISYMDSSAEHVYQVVSSLLNTLIESTLSSGRTDSIKAQEFLNKQISEHEGRLSDAEQRLAAFKKKNVGLMPDERGGYYSRFQLALADVRDTSSELRLAKRRLLELQAQLQNEKPTLGSRNAALPVTQLDRYKAQLDELLSQYTEQHPDVQALKLKIAGMEKSGVAGVDPENGGGSGTVDEFNPVYQELKGEISKASVDVETLKIKLSEKEERVSELRKSVDAIPEVEAELSKLNRDYEITRERYLNLVERRESARMGQEVGKSGGEINFRIIEPPVVPILPVGPNRLRLLAIVLIIALGAGLGWSFLRDQLRPTFINISQLTNSTELPVLGAVSLFLTPQHQRNRRLQLTSFFVGLVLLVTVFGGVAWFHDTGPNLVRGMITEVGL